ncbi:MAG: tetratricopeptide repeat protein [Rhodospirillales bacterium]
MSQRAGKLADAVKLLNDGDPAGAEAAALAILEVGPSNGAACFVAGVAAQALGHRKAAAARYERAITLGHDDGEVWRRLGACRAHLGDFEGAREALTLANDRAPGDARILNNLAVINIRLGFSREAVKNCRQALKIEPDYPAALNNLGIALQHEGEMAEAEALHRRAISLKPELADAWANLGVSLRAQSRYGEAIDAFRKSVALQPGNPSLHSNLLLCLHYDPSQTAETIWQEHRIFGERFGAGLEDGAEPKSPPVRVSDETVFTRPLRVGYISPDLRSHSVAFFLEPVLKAHDPGRVEVTCYSDVAAPDGVTARLQQTAAGWRDLRGLDDAAIVRMVREDGIDLLVDLAGHTAGNRLAVFGQRAAPVQVTWLGYPGTTGLAEMDYRLTDAVADPGDDCHSERLVRLPAGFHCYGPPPDAPAPARHPDRAPTFGSFNNLSKVTPDVIRHWSRLTASVPGARLLLKSRSLADLKVQDQMRELAGTDGLSPERLVLIGHVPDMAAHLALYGEVDVALDPYPYAGTTTTCEALWMGVPVVTLRGDCHAGRVGASLLTTTGLEHWITDDIAGYDRVAADLISNAEVLDHWRATLRPQVAASPLCDAAGFSLSLERAFHQMWRAKQEID